MKNKYKIIADLQLIILLYLEEININSIINFINILTEDVDYNPSYNVISDFRNVQIDDSEDEIKKFVDFLINNNKTKGKRNSAIVTSTPNQVVVSTLYFLNKSELQTTIQIFSTLKGASEWLDYTYEEYLHINDIIKNLTNYST